MKKLQLIFMCTSLTFLSACALNSGIGSKAGDIPPQLVNADTKLGVKWNNNAAFGPVPANQQLAGDALCQKELGTLKTKATGYHPKALDKAGKAIDGGGFLCNTAFL